jgi:hypothetical protein
LDYKLDSSKLEGQKSVKKFVWDVGKVVFLDQLGRLHSSFFNLLQYVHNLRRYSLLKHAIKIISAAAQA